MATTRIPIHKVCECCGKSFVAYKASTRFCSKKCNGKDYKLRMRERFVRQTETAMQEEAERKANFKRNDREYLTPKECAPILGIDVRSVYNLIYKGVLPASRLTSRTTIIRRTAITAMLDSQPYQKRKKAERNLITDFYTTAEILAKYSISESWLYKIAKQEKFPKTLVRKQSYYSKKHVDAYFKSIAVDSSITEWCSVADLECEFGMTKTAVYSLACTYAIPKKKEGREVFYSRQHVLEAKGLATAEVPQYYTVKEACEKFGVTRDMLYNYAKAGNVPKEKEGRCIKYHKRELDAYMAKYFAPPTL